MLTKRIATLGGKLLSFSGLALAVAISSGSASATAVIFNFTFDATIAANFGANAGNFMNAFTAAGNVYSSNYSDPIHVNIAVTSVTGVGTLGMSSQSIFNQSYLNLYKAVTGDAKTADDNTSIGAGGSVTAADPSGGNDLWWVTHAQEKALGLIGDTNVNGDDGTITIGSGFNYTYNNSGGVAGGTIDLEGVALHEIAELMGRIGLTGAAVAGSPAVSLLDEFAYTGGGRGLTNGGNGVFFSINNGTNLLTEFNDHNTLGGDTRDWCSQTSQNAACNTPDAYNAFSSSGVVNAVTATDLREMDVIGWDRVISSATPEPTTGLLLISALSVGAFLRRRLARSQK